MLNILIIEGNSREIIERNRSEGIDLASTCYKNALSIHAPEANYDITMPFVPEQGTPLTDLDQYDGIVLTGSGVNYTPSHKEAKPYMDALDVILGSKKPILGSCWGMQSVSVALGGESKPNDKGVEAGIAMQIKLTDEGVLNPALKTLPKTFNSPCIHRDHVTRLPVGAKHLAYNDVSENQAMSYDLEGINFLGVQFHPELEFNYIDRLLERRKGTMAEGELIYFKPSSDDHCIHNAKERTKVIGNWIREYL